MLNESTFNDDLEKDKLVISIIKKIPDNRQSRLSFITNNIVVKYIVNTYSLY